MAYEKIGFSSGDVLKASDLNHMEEGIKNATPVRGVDYFTEADKAKWSEYIASELAKRGQLKPEFANSISECEDESLLYVLPDGYIYAYMLTEVQTDPPELYDETALTLNSRHNSSNQIVSGNGYILTQYLPVNLTGNSPVVLCIKSKFNLRGTDPSFQRIGYYDANKNVLGSQYIDNANSMVELADGVLRLTVGYNKSDKLAYYDKIAFVRIDMYTAAAGGALTSGAGYISSIIVEGTGRTAQGYAWANTGHAFVPADYEDRILALESDSADHEFRLKLLEANESGSGVPAYWLEELDTKADAIQQAMEAAGCNKSAFLWYTDSHWTAGNAKVSPALLDYLYRYTPMTKVNFGGDIIGDPATLAHANVAFAYNEWRKAIKNLPNHHSVIGNHDNLHKGQSDGDVSNIVYSFLIAPEESPDMVMGGDLYYYIDNPCEKTRYLYLDSGRFALSDDETAFMIEALKTVADGWHVVVISHIWFQYTSASTPTVGSINAYMQKALNLFDAYNARESGSITMVSTAHQYDFTDCGGKVECCIGGHIHVDYDLYSAGGIPVILTASDVNQERSGDETEDSGTVGTITESAVYGIIADYTNNKITVVGIGRGGSRVINK